jgi:translation initiation factor IF-1
MMHFSAEGCGRFLLAVEADVPRTLHKQALILEQLCIEQTVEIAPCRVDYEISPAKEVTQMSDQKVNLNNAINNNETQAEAREDQAMQENTIKETNEAPTSETANTENAISPSGEEATTEAADKVVAQRLVDASADVVAVAKTMIGMCLDAMESETATSETASSEGNSDADVETAAAEIDPKSDSDKAADDAKAMIGYFLGSAAADMVEGEPGKETAEKPQQKAQPPIAAGMIFQGKVLRVEATQVVFTGPGAEAAVPDAPEGLVVGQVAYLEIVSVGPDGMMASYESAQLYVFAADQTVQGTIAQGGINLEAKTITVVLSKGQVVTVPIKRVYGADKMEEGKTYNFRVQSASPRKKQIHLIRHKVDEVKEKFPLGYTFAADELTVSHVDRKSLIIKGNGTTAKADRKDICHKSAELVSLFKKDDKLPGGEVIGYNSDSRFELQLSLKAKLQEQVQKEVDATKGGQVFKQARVSQVSVNGNGLRICVNEQTKIIVQVSPKEMPETITVDGTSRKIKEGDLVDVVILAKTKDDPVASFIGSITRVAEVPLLLRAVQSKTIYKAVFESSGKIVVLKDNKTGEPFKKQVANVKLELANGITVEAHPTVSINARFKAGDVLEVTVTEYDAVKNQIRTRALPKRDQRQDQKRRG